MRLSNWTENFRLNTMVTCLIQVQDLLVGHPLWRFATSIKVIIILSLYERYFWPNVVAIDNNLHLTSVDLWPLWRSFPNLASVILLTMFGSHGALFTIFDLCWPLISMKVIVLLNLDRLFFWPCLVAIEHSLLCLSLTSVDLWSPIRSSLFLACISGSTDQVR